MGVDYSACGGIGIYVTEKMFETIKNKYNLSNDLSKEDILDESGVYVYTKYGSYYSKDSIQYAFIIEGDTYLDIVKEVPNFLNSINSKLDLNLTEKDLILIVEGLIW